MKRNFLSFFFLRGGRWVQNLKKKQVECYHVMHAHHVYHKRVTPFVTRRVLASLPAPIYARWTPHRSLRTCRRGRRASEQGRRSRRRIWGRDERGGGGGHTPSESVCHPFFPTRRWGSWENNLDRQQHTTKAEKTKRDVSVSSCYKNDRRVIVRTLLWNPVNDNHRGAGNATGRVSDPFQKTFQTGCWA